MPDLKFKSWMDFLYIVALETSKRWFKDIFSASWLTPRVWFAKPKKLAQNKIWIYLTFSVNQHDRRNEFNFNLFRIQIK